MIVLEEAPQSLPTEDRSVPPQVGALWDKQLIPSSLMIAFAVVVCDELPNRAAERFLSTKISRSRQDSLMVRTKRSA